MAGLLLVVIYIAFISLGLPDSLFGVTWPVIHLDLGVDEGFAALYMLIVGAGTAGVSFIAGPIIRKLGTGWVTAVSVMLTVLGLIGMSIAPGIGVIIISSILMGIGAGAVDTGLNDFVSKHYKARHMSWLHCFWGIGVTVSPLIMSLFLEQGNWRSGYRSTAIIQLCLAAVMFISLPLWKKVTAKNQIQVVAENAPQKSSKKFNIFKERGVVFAAVSLAIYCGMEYLVGVWGASYFVHIFDFSPATAARYIAMYYGGIMAGRFVTGILTVKLSNKILIRFGTIFAIVGITMLLLPVKALMLPGLLLIGMGFAPIFPCTIDSTKTRFNSRYSADIIGFQMGFAYVGAISFQLIVGFVATRTTFMILPFILLALGILLLVDVEHINRITSSKTAEMGEIGSD
jgi:fucose permease